VIFEGGPSPPKLSGDEPEAILRAKYLDYCSAQVADILLLLSPDEMFVLAQDAAREAGVAGDLSYEEIVDLATGRVSRKLALPSFEDWVQDYMQNPDQYEEQMMGLWESDIERPNDDDPS
jgi:hypothetical protein